MSRARFCIVATALVVFCGLAHADEPKHARLRVACDKGDLVACNELGLALTQGDEIAPEKEGVELIGRACDGGLMIGCHNLAWVYDRGLESVTKDIARPPRCTCARATAAISPLAPTSG